MKKLAFSIILLFSFFVFANTTIKSVEEDYYDFLVLTGRAERPYLTYRTLSINEYSNENGFWNLPDNKKGNFTVYSPELFSSYNYQRPYGQNDGGLWQGVGINAQLKAGLSYSTHGFSFTFKPEFDFSQNQEYETMHNKNEYYWGTLDKPQRFGDDIYYLFDFGDSDIRYNYGPFTVGFGTQALWLGPTYLNAVLHSNNAGTYPRIDIGVKKTNVNIPWTDLSIGNIEAFYSLGIIRKTDYAVGSKEDTFLHLISFAWQPSFLKELTIGGNLVTNNGSDQGVGELVKRVLEWHSVNGEEDVKISLTLDFLLPKSGFEFYTEIGWDDLSSNIIANCFHTMVHQVGFKKSVEINSSRGVYGELICECGNMEMSRDAFTQWSYNFYTHHGVPNTYTNKGQIIGAGTGYAGNSQYLEFKVFYPKGVSSIYLQRSNPDNNYILSLVNGKDTNKKYFHNFKGIADIGIKTTWLGFENLQITGSLVYDLIMSDQYKENYFGESEYDMTHNFHADVVIKYTF